MGDATLEQYQRHLEKFGPRCLLETAAHELTKKELSQLKALIGSTERTQRFHKGKWVYRGQEVRQCATCGLDLPRGASSRMRRHAHCRKRAQRARQAARRPPSAVDAPQTRQTRPKAQRAVARAH
jgi:hypothetical protein